MKLYGWTGWVITLGVLVGLVELRDRSIDRLDEAWDLRTAEINAGIHDYFASRYALQQQEGGGFNVAFPGVAGWGAEALVGCDRSQVYVHRTTPAGLASVITNDLHDDYLDVIVFTQGGWYYEDNLKLLDGFPAKKCVYVAGQTAPGGGVGFYSDSSNTMISWYRGTEDFVWRHTTFAQLSADVENSLPSLYIRGAKRLIFANNDHWWNMESIIDMGPVADLDTVLNILIYNNLMGPPAGNGEQTCCTFRDATELNEGNGWLSRITYYANLFHTIGWRSPLWSKKSSLYDFHQQGIIAGNVWYNTGVQANTYGEAQIIDVIDSYIKTGPMSSDGVGGGASNKRAYAVSIDLTGSSEPDSTSLYVERLIGINNRDTLTISDSLWAKGNYQEVACRNYDCEATGGGSPLDSLIPAVKRDTPQTAPPIPIPRVNPYTQKDLLIGSATDSGQVGNWRGIACDGTWYARADTIHSMFLKFAQDSTGWSITTDKKATVNSWGKNGQGWTKPAGTACRDNDTDGMPNAFEVRIQGGTDSTGALVAGDPDGDGWTNVEEYVNGTNPLIFTEMDGYESPGIPAFPGAQGWGAPALSIISPNNCRAKPLKLWRVTNVTGYSGEAGTFDSVINNLSDANYDIVVFDAGGTHHHSGSHLIDNDCVYIAGQTAPGDGFANRNQSGSGGIQINEAQDVVVRSLSLNGDDEDSDNTNKQLLRILSEDDDGSNRTRYIVVDHVSARFQRDQFVVAATNSNDSTVSDVTISYSVVGADIDGPGFNFSTGNDTDYPQRRLSGHHNFLAELRHRLPVMSSCIFCEWYENIAYNWGREGLVFKDGYDLLNSQSQADIIANHWKPGPRSYAQSGQTEAIQVWVGEGNDREPRIYVSKNISDAVSMDSAANQKNLVTYRGDKSGPVNDTVFKANPLVSGVVFPITRRWSSINLKDELLPIVGNSWRVDCDGRKVYDRRDALDDSLVAHFINNTGRDSATYGSVSQLGGLPTYNTGSVCDDTDTDGLPDDFEQRIQGGSDVTGAVVTGDPDDDGWWNIEEYINGSNPVVFTFPDGTEQTPATNLFPGAVGAGARALRDGTCSFDSTVVFHVTRMVDSTAKDNPADGSLRAVLGYEGQGFNDSLQIYPDSVVKYVVFDSAGVFYQQTNDITIGEPCVIVAWQTAPGNGWWHTPVASARYQSTGQGGLKSTINNDPLVKNIVVSHPRITTGKDTLCDGCEAQSPGTYDATDAAGDVISWTMGPNSIIQHAELYGGNDAIADATGQGFTLMRSILAVPTKPHNTARLAKGPADTSSVYRNLWIAGNSRVPGYMGRGSREEYVENVIYGASSRFHNVEGDSAGIAPECPYPSPGCIPMSDEIGNLYMEGPKNSHPHIQIVLDNSGQAKAKSNWTGRLYYKDNVLSEWGTPVDTYTTHLVAWKDRDSEECSDVCELTSGELTTVSRLGRLSAFLGLDNLIEPSLVRDSATIADSVFAGVGVSWLLECNGTKRAVTNAMRDRMINWVKSGYSNTDIMFPDSMKQLDTTNISYGVPTNLGTSATTCTDQDGDGLPSAYEGKWGLDSLSAAGINGRDGDPDGDGYVNMIEYLFPCGSEGNDPLSWTNPDCTEGYEPPPPPPAGVSKTWGQMYARRIPAKDSMWIAGNDTYTFLWLQPESVPFGISFFAIRDTKATLARALILTCDSTTLPAAVLDSIAADDTATVMGRDPDSLRNVIVPGC